MCLQESSEKKQEWLVAAMQRMPRGTRVVVRYSDLPSYVGQRGEVVGYDTGTSGEWPTVRVKLESGVTDSFFSDGNPDGDEIEVL